MKLEREQVQQAQIQIIGDKWDPDYPNGWNSRTFQPVNGVKINFRSAYTDTFIDMHTVVIRYTEPGKSYMATRAARRSVKVGLDGTFNLDQARRKYRELVRFYAHHRAIERQVMDAQQKEYEDRQLLKAELGMKSEDMLIRSRQPGRWKLSVDGLTDDQVQGAMNAINALERGYARAGKPTRDSGASWGGS